MTPAAFRAQIARGATEPVYMAIGDDDHEKSALALALGEMIEEDLRAFNVERLYAIDGTVTARAVAEAAQTLPMIAPRRIVIVLQAEKLFDPRKRRKAGQSAYIKPSTLRGDKSRINLHIKPLLGARAVASLTRPRRY